MKGDMKELHRLLELFRIIVIPFESAPQEIKDLGGVIACEKWVIVHKDDYDDSNGDWLDLTNKLGADGFNTYEVEGLSVTITDCE